MVADSFVKVLMGIHHHRIAYPGYDFNRAGAPAVLSQVTPADVAAATRSDALPVTPLKEASGD